MARYDRLSSLLAHFELQVFPCDDPVTNLSIFEDRTTGLPTRVVLSPRKRRIARLANEVPLFLGDMEWGGEINPLFLALPENIELDISDDQETTNLVLLLKTENEARRCGSESVLNRIGEIIIVRVMRVLIERGDAPTGLFSGLSDKRLSRAIVAIHDNPGRVWRNEDLAEIAGLSLSRFAQLFHEVVGETPIGYLRRWRLILARQDVMRGDRVQEIARRYAYGSSEALTRAFGKHFGESPLDVRGRKKTGS